VSPLPGPGLSPAPRRPPSAAPDARPDDAADADGRTTRLDVRMTLLAAMARALSRYGETCDDIEEGLASCARALGLRAQFSVTPTVVLASFGEFMRERTLFMRISEGAIDLRGLSLVRALLFDVTDGRTTPDLGLSELRLIESSPSSYAWPLRVLGSALGAAALSVFLGGGGREFLVSLPVGLAVGLLVVLGRRYTRLTLLTEVLAGLTAVSVAMLMSYLAGGFSVSTVSLAGVILLLPGMSITMGVAELTSRHLTAGTARLAGATVSLLNLSIGSLLGFTLYQRVDLAQDMAPASEPVAPALLALAVVVMACSLVISTHARVHDAPLILGAVCLALAGARFGSWLIDPTVGVGIASLIVGLAANAYERVTRRAAALVLVPGLLVLVPGALGLRGVQDFVGTAQGGMAVLADVLIIAASLVVGFALADTMLPGRKHVPHHG